MRRRHVIVIGSLVATGVALAALQFAPERETVIPVEVANPDGGAGHALVLYHPGLSDLQDALSDAFVAELVERDWRVNRATTSASAPTDVESYDLLALGVHTHWWAPDGPTRRYLDRVGDLGGTPVVVLLSALGAAGRAEARSVDWITRHGGRVVEVRPFFVMRPNDETDPRPNRAVALERAGELAAAVDAALR
jgi:hypothetical protein